MTVLSTIALPTYTTQQIPDYQIVGPVLDRHIETHYPNQAIAIRGLSLVDHPTLTRDTLISLIIKHGTDRYDPQRQGIHHEYYAPYNVELHAVPCRVSDRLRGLDDDDYAAAESVMAEFLADCYEGALAERGYPLRLDLLLIFDLAQLTPIFIDSKHSLAFSFKQPDQREAALLGIISVT